MAKNSERENVYKKMDQVLDSVFGTRPLRPKPWGVDLLNQALGDLKAIDSYDRIWLSNQELFVHKIWQKFLKNKARGLYALLLVLLIVGGMAFISVMFYVDPAYNPKFFSKVIYVFLLFFLLFKIIGQSKVDLKKTNRFISDPKNLEKIKAYLAKNPEVDNLLTLRQEAAREGDKLRDSQKFQTIMKQLPANYQNPGMVGHLLDFFHQSANLPKDATIQEIVNGYVDYLAELERQRAHAQRKAEEDFIHEENLRWAQQQKKNREAR